MGERNYWHILVEGFFRAIPWAIVFSMATVATAAILMGMIRQEVKEAMEYGSRAMIREAMHMIVYVLKTDPDVVPAVKQNTKEAIEFMAETLHRKPIVSADEPSRAKR